MNVTDTRVVRVTGFLVGAAAATVGLNLTFGGFDANEIFILAGLGFALLALGPKRGLAFRLNGYDLVAVAYVGTRVLVEVLSADALLHSANISGLSLSYCALGAYICARIAVSNAEELRSFFVGMVIPSLAVSAIALVQILRIGGIDTAILQITNSAGAASRLEDGRLARATSLIGHWSGLGGYLFCIIAVCGIVLVLDRGKRPTSKIVLISFIAALLGVATTFTFAAVIGAFVIAVVTLAVLGFRIRGLVILGILGGAAWMLFGDSISARIDLQTTETNYLPEAYSWLPATLSVRIHYWLTEGLPAFAEQPIVGWGHSVYSLGGDWPIQPSTIIWRFPESEYIKALVTGGILEFAALVAFLVAAVMVMRRSRRSLPSGPSHIGLSAVYVVIAGSVINPYLTNPGAPAVFWPLIGAMVWAAARPRGEHGNAGDLPQRRPTAVTARSSSSLP